MSKIFNHVPFPEYYAKYFAKMPVCETVRDGFIDPSPLGSEITLYVTKQYVDDGNFQMAVMSDSQLVGLGFISTNHPDADGNFPLKIVVDGNALKFNKLCIVTEASLNKTFPYFLFQTAGAPVK